MHFIMNTQFCHQLNSECVVLFVNELYLVTKAFSLVVLLKQHFYGPISEHTEKSKCKFTLYCERHSKCNNFYHYVQDHCDNLSGE